MGQSGKKKLAGIIAGGAVAMSSLLGASLARATTKTTITAGRAKFTLRIDTDPPTSSFMMIDGTIVVPNASPTISYSDAFDGALEIRFAAEGVTNTNYSTTDSDCARTGIACLERTSVATVDNNGPSGVSTVSGVGIIRTVQGNLDVTYTLTFDPLTESVTQVATITNNSGGPIAGTLFLHTNFGSDSSTQVESTSSGDNILGSSDTWVITTEGGNEDPGADPVILSRVLTPGLNAGLGSTLNGTDDLNWTVAVNLANGDSQELSAQHRLFTSIASAQASVAGESAATPVPAIGTAGLLGLSLLTGIFGAAGAMRNRNKKAA